MRARVTLSDLVGANGALSGVCARAAIAADSDATFALFGEAGVGKETLARAIAAGSPYTPGPFVLLRAGRLSEERWSALASGAPDFAGRLVYIADAELIPRIAGRRLATAIRSGKLGYRVAFGTTVGYDVLAGSRQFAPELAELCAAFPIAVPPLRDRLEELPDFAALFFHDACDRLGVWRDAFSASELDRLRASGWGVELENLDGLRRLVDRVVERDVFPVDDAEIREFASADAESAGAPVLSRTAHVPGADAPAADSAASASASDSDADASGGRFLTLDEAAKEHIERALRRSHGVVDGKNGAAVALDINPYTLRARMRKLGVDWTRFRDDPDAESDDDDGFVAAADDERVGRG